MVRNEKSDTRVAWIWMGRVARALVVAYIGVVAAFVAFPAIVFVGRQMLHSSMAVGKAAGIHVDKWQVVGLESLLSINAETVVMMIPGALVLLLVKSVLGNPVEYFRELWRTLRAIGRTARGYVVAGVDREESGGSIGRSSLLLAGPFILLGIGGMSEAPPQPEIIEKTIAILLKYGEEKEPPGPEIEGEEDPEEPRQPYEPSAMPRPSAQVAVKEVDGVSFGEPHFADWTTLVQVTVGPGGEDGQHAVVCGYVGSSAEPRAVAAAHYGFTTPNPVSTFSMLVEQGQSWRISYCNPEQTLPTNPTVTAQEIHVNLDWGEEPSGEPDDGH